MESIKVFSKKLVLIPLLTTAFCIHSQAAAPQHGKERLRELVVFPEMSIQRQFKFNFNEGLYWMSDGESLTDDISTLRQELKSDPENIQKLLKLGYLYELNDQTNQSEMTFKYANAICRSRLDSHPKDGLLLVDLGITLSRLEKFDEAESVYRKAVLVESNRWQCWAGMGWILLGRSADALAPKHLRGQLYSPNGPWQEALDYHPSADDMKEAERLRQEADRCIERARALATNEPEAFIYFGGYAGFKNLYGCFLRHYRDQAPVDARTLRATFFNREITAELRKAADIDQKNVQLIAVAAFFDYSSGMMQVDPAHPDPENVPEDSERFIQVGVTRLKKLSENSDPITASRALQDMVMLHLMTKKSPADQVDLARRAVKLNPDNDQGWELWLALSTDTASTAELIGMCESRLKQKNSARNHLLLGKLFVKQSNWEKVEAEAEAALDLEPENITAHLMRGALLIRQSTSPETLNAASPSFEKVKTLLEKMPDGEEKQKRIREWTLDGIIAYALLPDEEMNKEAKESIKKFTVKFPDDEDAKKIREAME